MGIIKNTIVLAGFGILWSGARAEEGQITEAARPTVIGSAASVTPAPAGKPGATGSGASAFETMGLTLHDVGEPTDAEQYTIELINRARDNAVAEASRLSASTDPDVLPNYESYALDKAYMVAEMTPLPKAPPLAPNKNLTKSARDHSQWMLNTQSQYHEEDLATGGYESLQDRFKRQGYLIVSTPPGPDPGRLAENIYAYGVSLDEIRAAFEADWGYNTQGQMDHGMQTGRGHRVNTHEVLYREVGVGIVEGIKENITTEAAVGSMLATEDYGRTYNSANKPFVTGVAYYDYDGDGFYTPGEGIGGVTVNVTGSTEYAVTSKSGAYAVTRDVTGNSEAATVSFSGLSVSQSTAVTISNKQNVKTDLKPVYTPPKPAGAATVVRGVPATFTYPTVPGATGYTLAVGTKAAASTFDCGSYTKATVDTAGSSYSTLDTTVASTSPGTSWHLAHPYDATVQIIRPQTIRLTPQYLCSAGTKLTYKSRMRGARLGQAGKVQVSWDGGTYWKTVDFVRGFASGNGDTTFTSRTVDLGAYSGKMIQVRFAYTGASTGNFASGTSSLYGWFIDDVAFATSGGSPTTHEVTLTDKGAVSGGSFTWTPTTAGVQQLCVRPVISGKNWPYSAPLEVTVTEPAGYQAAVVTKEATLGLTAGTLSLNPNDDYDKDGLPNLVEYAFGLNPAANNSSTRLLTPAAATTAGKCEVTYSKDKSITGVTLVVQASKDGTNWYTPGQAGAPAGMQLTDTVSSTAGNIETHKASAYHLGKPLFFRVKVTQQ